jgi:GDP/UDP-N,N'-diacetylbacillosamine 2-epimerase (hydrolysing)
MSHLHFTSTEEYRQRVIQMGENPKTVFNVGAPGIDNILNSKLLGKDELEKRLGIQFKKRNLLITFHPVTLENNTAGQQFIQLLEAVDELEDTLLIFTKPNSDKGGRIIIDLIDDFVKNNPHKAISFTSMGHLNYLSAIPLMDAVVGNSSSGIIEVPVFNVPTVNIGNRQKGRITGPSIINCEPERNAIKMAIGKAFQFDKNKKWEHPYGKGNASEQILKMIKEALPVKISKSFYDL